MKLKYIVALIAGLAITTAVVEAKGNGKGKEKRDQAKECTQDSDSCTKQDCTKKQDCSKASSEDCTKEKSDEGSGNCDQKKSAGKGEGKGKGKGKGCEGSCGS